MSVIHHALWQTKRISTEKKAGKHAHCVSRSPRIHANLFPGAPGGCVGYPKEQNGGDGLLGCHSGARRHSSAGRRALAGGPWLVTAYGTLRSYAFSPHDK